MIQTVISLHAIDITTNKALIRDPDTAIMRSNLMRQHRTAT